MPTLNTLMAALVGELEEGEIPTPLAQSFTLANIWADLARLAGEEPPAAVLALLGEALDAICEPLPVRCDSYDEPALQFAPAD